MTRPSIPISLVAVMEVGGQCRRSAPDASSNSRDSKELLKIAIGALLIVQTLLARHRVSARGMPCQQRHRARIDANRGRGMVVAGFPACLPLPKGRLDAHHRGIPLARVAGDATIHDHDRAVRPVGVGRGQVERAGDDSSGLPKRPLAHGSGAVARRPRPSSPIHGGDLIWGRGGWRSWDALRRN